jgi:short chain dehydrogenase
MASIASNVARAVDTAVSKVSSAMSGVAGQPTQSTTVLRNESAMAGLGKEADVQKVYFQMQQEREKSVSGEPKQPDKASRQAEMRFTPDCGEQSYKGTSKMVGKRALISGGDSGIGRAIAIAFAREGADVCIIYRSSREDADDVVKIIRETTPQRCVAIQADLSTREACKMAVDRAVLELGGPITTLVNNAGQQFSEGGKTGEVKGMQKMAEGAKGGAGGGESEAGKALESACEHLDDIFASNIFSNFYLSAECAKGFRPDEGNSIVFITSVK